MFLRGSLSADKPIPLTPTHLPLTSLHATRHGQPATPAIFNVFSDQCCKMASESAKSSEKQAQSANLQVPLIWHQVPLICRQLPPSASARPSRCPCGSGLRPRCLGLQPPSILNTLCASPSRRDRAPTNGISPAPQPLCPLLLATPHPHLALCLCAITLTERPCPPCCAAPR